MKAFGALQRGAPAVHYGTAQRPQLLSPLCRGGLLTRPQRWREAATHSRIACSTPAAGGWTSAEQTQSCQQQQAQNAAGRAQLVPVLLSRCKTALACLAICAAWSLLTAAIGGSTGSSVASLSLAAGGSTTGHGAWPSVHLHVAGRPSTARSPGFWGMFMHVSAVQLRAPLPVRGVQACRRP